MDQPLRLVAIVGSLRKASFNRAVFDAAAALLPPRVTLTEVSLAEVPLYDGDLETQGAPAAVAGLKEAVAAADGLLVLTPEYNHSVPAVTKNAIDWLSRPFRKGPLVGKPVGIVAASPGPRDAPGVRDHLSVAVRMNTEHLFDPTLGFSRITEALKDGVLTDPEARDRLAAWLRDFAAYARTAGG